MTLLSSFLLSPAVAARRKDCRHAAISIPVIQPDIRKMNGWISGLNSALDVVKQQAVKLSEEAVQAAQALRDVALEANQEILAEQERVKASADPTAAADHIVTLLPWEPEDEAKSILSQPLMEQVFALSLSEENFQILASEERGSFDFKLENYVTVAMKLLEIDPNLKKMHAKLGARVAEEEFWRSYFFRCACLRAEIGMGSGRDYSMVAGASSRSTSRVPSSSSSQVAAADQAAASADAVPTSGTTKTASPQKAQAGVGLSGGEGKHVMPPQGSTQEGEEGAGGEGDDDLELDGLEDAIDDVDDDDVDGQDLEALDAEIAKELEDL